MSTEYEYTGEIARGAKGARVKLVQEWLCLHGQLVVIDGQFGPATGQAVCAFQQRQARTPTGVVDRATFDGLVAPMLAALRAMIPPTDATLGAMIVRAAEQHLAQHPREVGGENMGPWVRLYMGGNQGKEWRWCGGFVSFVVRQAARALNVRLPLIPSFSCDVTAERAMRGGCFRKGSSRVRRAIPVGSLFLVRRAVGLWSHVGVVTGADAEVFHTIEGNTNDRGEPEGYEVCARIRG